MKIYISHSVGCAGWDMEDIYRNTLFRTGCRTMRFKEADIGKVKMLDWDYNYYMVKDPITEKKIFDPLRFQKVADRHIELTKEYDFDVVMSMDFWGNNQRTCLDYTDELQKYCDRVLIPVHHWSYHLNGYDLAYPNANWFIKNIFPPAKYRDQIKHILGGSPQSQIEYLTTDQLDLFKNPLKFRKVESIDGNQIFNVAIRAGKEWYPNKPNWRKPKMQLTNELIFKNSVKKLDKIVKSLKKRIKKRGIPSN